MRVLVDCEESQRVCIAFREKGHEAFSCDIVECSGNHPEWHVQGDVIPLLNGHCEFTLQNGQTVSQSVRILDATCGDRTIWFQKNEPHTTYCDIRKEEWEGDFGKTLNKDGKQKHRHLVIDPDIQCSFTDLPFSEGEFNLVIFDPPHITNLKESSWMRKSYGSLDGNWKPMIRKGFQECMRVLKTGGVLIFKWSDTSVSTREILNTIGMEPLFGHRSGKRMNTHWMCFMKFEEEP